MKRFRWQIAVGLSLILSSVFLYIAHYAIFRDLQHIFLWSVTSLAFLPISVLLVTLIIDGLLDRKEKRTRLEKLNMLIGTFFSKVGTKLLIYFSDWDPQLDRIRKSLIVTDNWSEQEFVSVSKRLKTYEYRVDNKKIDLENLRAFLRKRENFLLRLLENPNLLEHESFTQLLQAVFHLAEELDKREDIKQLPDTDLTHLAGDMERTYILLVHQWLDYMKYVKDNYPYLFSLAMRTNPFDQDASPVVG